MHCCVERCKFNEFIEIYRVRHEKLKSDLKIKKSKFLGYLKKTKTLGFLECFRTALVYSCLNKSASIGFEPVEQLTGIHTFSYNIYRSYPNLCGRLTVQKHIEPKILMVVCNCLADSVPSSLKQL